METDQVGRRWVYGGLACVTCATLVLELTLTRIFSVVMFYHFAFLAISLALFGLGAAGVYLYLRPKSAEGDGFLPAVRHYTIGAAVTTDLALTYVLRQEVNLQFASDNLKTLAGIYVVTAIPFFFSGLCITAVINRYHRDMGRLYFWDLAGAAVGCLMLTTLLSWFGGIHTVLLCGVLFAVGALLFTVAERGRAARRWILPVLVVVAAVAAPVVNSVRPTLVIPSVKGTQEGKVVFSKWNSFSRVTVEKTSGDYYWLKYDSSAATRIFGGHVAKDGWKKTRKSAESRVASLVYCLGRPGKALIIGPGGGADVIGALYLGQKSVVGVELNPITVNDVMLDEFRDYSGGLYARPDVTVYADEGRSFIRSQGQKYGSIQATLVDTWAATAAGAFTLSENGLYTREAFRDYLDHLDDDGLLTMTRWLMHPPREFVRLLGLGRDALEQVGVFDHERHFYIATADRRASFLLKRSPFTEEEVKVLDDYVKREKLRTIYSPYGTPRQNPYDEFLRTKDWRGYIAAQSFDLSPPTDDRPFFFYTVRPSSLTKVFADPAKETEHNLGLLMLLIVLGVVTVLVTLVFLLPLFFFRRDVLRGDRAGKARYLLYFVGLGAGFIIVEIALMQKFVLFLGHPTYALIVVLFSLLMFSGVGSYRMRDVRGADVMPKIGRHLLVLCGVTLLYMLTLSTVFGWLVTMPLAGRMVLSVLLVAPLGLLMGTFLPLGIQGAGERFAVVVPWAWGINGAASVLGSVLAIGLAMNIGFNRALLAGLVAYGLGYIAVRGVLRVAP